MTLRDRLRSLRGTARPPAGTPPDDAAPSSADMETTEAAADLAALAPRADSATLPPRPTSRHAPHGPETLLPGRVHTTPHGPCFVAEWRYPLAYHHGHTPLGAVLDLPLDIAAPLLARRRDERLRVLAADPRRLIYLDTETTGLAGGTGTYAFLIGIGRFLGDEFVVRQFFLRDLDEEHAALHLLAEELAGHHALVTYNGKAFDWPLLETRYALARRGGPHGPGDPAAHIDLLFTARRLWKARLANCALGTVEHELLGVRRGDDVPGWLIPQLYFAYLRDRDARPLAGVFRHNALDLLSLAALLGHVAAIRAVAGAGALPTPADEVLGLGRCLAESGDLDGALACFHTAADGAGLASAAVRAAVTREARLRAGATLKRLRRAGEALAHWEALLARVGGAGAATLDLTPYEELAKYYEHAARDYPQARGYVLGALATLDAAGTVLAPAGVRARLLHRLARLERLCQVAD
ncbi:MAG TPA: ribonuclease H-like domain-containing protein [Ktedonobacterales bacterium]